MQNIIKRAIGFHKGLLLTLMALTLALSASAQTKITGRVVDENGQPAIGANIIVSGTTQGASADIDGKFTLSVKKNATLIVSYLGYKTQEVKVGAQTDFQIKLQPDANIMDEVVVVGYGSAKRSDLTGSIASVSAKNIEGYQSGSVLGALSGQVAGVQITTADGTPGSGFEIKIRGIGTVNGDAAPLYIVDGFQVDNIDYLSSSDIEQVDMLKDASAAAIYGARAAFGVVLVTTKSGDSSGKTRVSYSGRWGWNEPTTSTDYETRGYYSVYLNDLFWRSYAGNNYTRYTEQDMMELWARRNDRTEHPDRPWVKIDQRDGRDTYVYYGNTDWYHYLFKDEHPNTSHSISLSGVNGRVDYLLSGSYYSEEGLFRQNPDKRRSPSTSTSG